jgi:hypothetical protein
MRGAQVPGLEQQKLHPVGIRHVHLASEGFQIDLFHKFRILTKFTGLSNRDFTGPDLNYNLLKKCT